MTPLKFANGCSDGLCVGPSYRLARSFPQFPANIAANLDRFLAAARRGMEAQKAIDLRRLLAEVKANESALRLHQDELEAHLAFAPAANWEETVEKARHVLGLYAATLTAEDTCRRTLVAAVLEDLERLASAQ